MLSYNNNQQLKNQVVAAIIADKENERMVKGKYWNEKEQKGCNIGCGEHAVCQILGEEFQDKRHQYLSRKLDVPEAIFWLGDTIFEGLPKEEANQFVVDFYQSIPVGKDLTHVIIDMKIAILTDTTFGSRQYASDDGKKAIDSIVELLNRSKSEEIRDEKWKLAESAAESAAWSAQSAAWSAAESAQSATRSAESAAESARSADWSADWSADESAARSAFFNEASKKLIKLLQQATTEYLDEEDTD
jgi:hypothetical protein